MSWFSASQSWARGGVKSLLSGRSIPAEELERALDDWCQPPPRAGSNKHTIKHAKAFKNIANLLSQFEDPMKKAEWAVRPRIYTILRNIGRLDTMPDFIEHKALDDMLPFPENELPSALGDSKRDFVQIQQYCLTDAKELEKGIAGKHVQFNYNADEHFIKLKELGGGGFG